MRNILCIGYSVTERYGFVEEVNRLAAVSASGVELCKSGWGGHRIDSIAYMIDVILDNFTYDEVVLELFTSGLRDYGMPRIRAYLDEILIATSNRTIPVYFLNLYDREIDYRRDFLTNEISALSTRLSIPFLDIASFVHDLPPEEIDLLLVDTVHPSSKGEELYGSMLHEFLAANGPRLDYSRCYDTLSRKFLAVSVPGLFCNHSFSVYDKHGFAIRFLKIPENNLIDIDFSARAEIVALMLCYGPETGRVFIKEVNSGEERGILAYDSFSYYERTGVFTIDRLFGRTFKIEQSEEIPAVELRKGVASLGPRSGKIAFLYCIRPEAAERKRHFFHNVLRAISLQKNATPDFFVRLFRMFSRLRLW